MNKCKDQAVSVTGVAIAVSNNQNTIFESKSQPYRLSRDTDLAWIDPITMEKASSKIAGGALLKETLNQVNKITKEKGQYLIKFAYKRKYGGGGHILTAERLEDGRLRIFDPQPGKIRSIEELSELFSLRYGLRVLRTDNLLINESMINGISTALK